MTMPLTYQRELAALQTKCDDLARQLGDITAVIAASTHLPQRDTIAETILAADGAIGRIEHKVSQARQETLREVAKALGAEEAFGAMVSLVGAEKATPEFVAEMISMCAASSPEEVALQFKAAKIEHPGILFTITKGDPFAGIMDGPEMMPTWDGPSDLGDVKMSAHCEGEGEGDQ